MSGERRTKRRYAHELYPHAEEYEVRPLSIEVPYLYARAIGMDVTDTGWFSADSKQRGDRTMQMIDSRHIALMADALLQGLTGDAAWEWTEHHRDHEGEMFYDAALKHVPSPELIKPYPCGPKPEHHFHNGEPVVNGWVTSTRVPGAEDECNDCTEDVTK